MARQGELTRQLAESLQEEERTFLIGQYAALLLDDLERDGRTEVLPADAAMALRVARRYAEPGLEARIDAFLGQRRVAGPPSSGARPGEGLFDDRESVPDAAGTGLFDAPTVDEAGGATAQAAAAQGADAAEARSDRDEGPRRPGRRRASPPDADLDLTALGAAADGAEPATAGRAEARGRQKRERGQADLPRRQARQERAGFVAKKGHEAAPPKGFEPGSATAGDETPGFVARRGHEEGATKGFEPASETAERETPGFVPRKGHEAGRTRGFEPTTGHARRDTPGFVAATGHEDEPTPGFVPGQGPKERDSGRFVATAPGEEAPQRGFTPTKGHEEEATPGFAAQEGHTRRQRRGFTPTQGHEAEDKPGLVRPDPPDDANATPGAPRARRDRNRHGAAAGRGQAGPLPAPGEPDADADESAEYATGAAPGPSPDRQPDGAAGDAATDRDPTAAGDAAVDDALFRADDAEGAGADSNAPGDRSRSGAAVADEQRRPTLGLTDAIQAQREAEAAARSEALARAAKARDELHRRRQEREAKQQAERDARSRRLAEAKPAAPRRADAAVDAGPETPETPDDDAAAEDEQVADDDLLAGLACAVSLDDLERYLGVKVVREDRALLERRMKQKLREAPVRALLRSLPESPVGYALVPRLARVVHAGQEVRLSTAQLIRRHLDLLDDAAQIVRRYKEAPFFLRETPATDWAIVSCDALPATLGKSYAQQRQAIKQYAASFQTSERRIGRRTVVEALFDMIIAQVVAKEPLLRRTVDMTDTKVGLNNLVFVNYGANGIRVSDIGRLDSHPQLGTCPVW